MCNEKRVVLSKLICTGTCILLLILSTLLVSIWWCFTMPVYHEHHEHVQTERLRNKIAFVGRACRSNTTDFVVLDCKAVGDALQTDLTKETLLRTVNHVLEEHPVMGFLLNHSFIDCSNETSTCMHTAHMLAEHSHELRWLSMLAIWMPLVLLLGYGCFQAGPKRYIVQLQRLSYPAMHSRMPATSRQPVTHGSVGDPAYSNIPGSFDGFQDSMIHGFGDTTGLRARNYQQQQQQQQQEMYGLFYMQQPGEGQQTQRG